MASGLGAKLRRVIAGFAAVMAAAPPPVAMAAADGVPPAAPASAAQPPRQADCPVVANIDFPWMQRELARQARRAPPVSTLPSSDMLNDVVVPADAARRPPADAIFVIRVRVPPGGGYARDERAVVWREADGSWWGWRDVEGGEPAFPPAPPAPGTPEEAAYDWNQSWDPYPPYEGRLDARQSATMEAAFADPCRALEPDFAPARYRLLKAEDGSRWRDCRQPVPDSSAYFAEITEAGRPPRRVSFFCLPGSRNGTLITWAAHVELPRTEPKPVKRE